MGEAKRRKQLDPGYGKTLKNARDLLNVVEIGLKIFPASFCKKYHSFRNSIWEYPCKEYIYNNYPTGLIEHIETLEHNIKCEFWGYLLFIDSHKQEFNQYINRATNSRPITSSVFIELWKYLFISSSVIEIVHEVGLDWSGNLLDMDKIKESMSYSFTRTKIELMLDYCYKVWSV